MLRVMPTTDPGDRPTQAERRAATRRALLDATLQTLVRHGYAATTTTAIVRAAGVSQGALFNHFDSKADLLGAAVEDVYPRLRETYADMITEGLGGGTPTEVARTTLKLLLDAMHQPEARAMTELLIAARSDAELAARLAPVEAAHRADIRRLAACVACGGEGATGGGGAGGGGGLDPDRVVLAVEIAIDLTYGMALSTSVADADRVDAELDLAAELLAPLLPTRGDT